MADTARQKVERRIEDVAGRHFAEVKGAASLAEVRQTRFRDRGVYVYPLRRSAGKSASDTFVAQRVQEQFGVVLVARNVRDPRGGDSTDAIEVMTQKIRSALLGWSIAEGYEQFTYAGGGQVAFIEQHLLWQEIYTTATYWRAGPC